MNKKTILVEHYKGYDIYYSGKGGMWSNYYAIFYKGERATLLALSSPLACRNVINTYTNLNTNLNINTYETK